MIAGRLGHPESGRNLTTLLAVAILLFFATCTLKPDNGEPQASFTIEPTVGTTDTMFVFDASGCSDPDEETRYLQVRWDWDGDGVWDTLWGSGKQRIHRYESIGSYAAALQVRDSWGEIDFCTHDVHVGEVVRYPVATFTVIPSSGSVLTDFHFDASGCSDDQDPPEVLQVRWDWTADGVWDTEWTSQKTAIHTPSGSTALTTRYSRCWMPPEPLTRPRQIWS